MKASAGDINTRQSAGNRGEELAVSFLRKKGFMILARNFRIRGGEIDIIALEKETLVFIEVKSRSSSRFGSPFEAITPWKMKALARAAQFYKASHKNLPDAMRIDAIGIKFFAPGGEDFEIEYMRNIGY